MKDPVTIYENCDESVGLLMTYRCNLDCKYCYIHRKRNRDMSLDMAKTILEPFLLKKEGLLNIAFLGGETLLAFDVIKPLVKWIEKGDRKGNWNRRYRLFGSTNGTLLNDDKKEWIRKHKQALTLGLSFDGLPSVQRNNRGNNDIDVDFFIQTWPRQPIQMTINAESVGRMADGVIYLLEKGASVHPNVAFEEEQWPEEKIAEYERQLDRLIDYYSTHNGIPPITQFIHNLNDYAYCLDNHVTQERGCGSGYGFQVYDTDGQAYPCHMLSPLVLEGEKLQDIKNGLQANTECFEDEECSTCPYTTSCPTCMACNYLYRNSLQKRDKTHCAIMKAEVRAFIRKEICRLKAKKDLTPEDATLIDSIKKLWDYEMKETSTRPSVPPAASPASWDMSAPTSTVPLTRER